jgi:hypothetical protein
VKPGLHARRLDALWKVRSSPALSDGARTAALLTIAAGALRPGHPFTCRLDRSDGDVLITEACSSEAPPEPSATVLEVPFGASDRRYVLTFATAAPLEAALDEDDRAFAELIAETLAEQLARLLQSQRIEANAQSRFLAQGVRPVPIRIGAA